MLSKRLTQIAAFLLVPCLLVDPTLAAGLFQPSFPRVSVFSKASAGTFLFNLQALSTEPGFSGNVEQLTQSNPMAKARVLTVGIRGQSDNSAMSDRDKGLNLGPIDGSEPSINETKDNTTPAQGNIAGRVTGGLGTPLAKVYDYLRNRGWSEGIIQIVLAPFLQPIYFNGIFFGIPLLVTHIASNGWISDHLPVILVASAFMKAVVYCSTEHPYVMVGDTPYWPGLWGRLWLFTRDIIESVLLLGSLLLAAIVAADAGDPTGIGLTPHPLPPPWEIFALVGFVAGTFMDVICHSVLNAIARLGARIGWNWISGTVTGRSDASGSGFNVLRALRNKAGLTQTQLGKEVDEKQFYISLYENGKRLIPADVARRLARFFHKRSTIFGGLIQPVMKLPTKNPRDERLLLSKKDATRIFERAMRGAQAVRYARPRKGWSALDDYDFRSSAERALLQLRLAQEKLNNIKAMGNHSISWWIDKLDLVGFYGGSAYFIKAALPEAATRGQRRELINLLSAASFDPNSSLLANLFSTWWRNLPLRLIGAITLAVPIQEIGHNVAHSGLLNGLWESIKHPLLTLSGQALVPSTPETLIAGPRQNLAAGIFFGVMALLAPIFSFGGLFVTSLWVFAAGNLFWVLTEPALSFLLGWGDIYRASLMGSNHFLVRYGYAVAQSA